MVLNGISDEGIGCFQVLGCAKAYQKLLTSESNFRTSSSVYL